VVETVTGLPSAAATAVPTATVSVTPVPVPTITPNRAYRNLKMGDRGAEVKRLQERLIELGYMPEGTADGAYGGQTRTAVRRFQYYNGLTVDGIAGRATQTNLFENPEAARYPGETTPAPTAEETPEAAETAEAPVTAEPKPTQAPDPTVTPVTVSARPEQTEAPAAEETTAVPEESASPAAEETAEAPGVSTSPAAEETEQASAESTTPAGKEEPSETPAPGPEGTELVENVDLDAQEVTPSPLPTEEPEELIFEDVAGWVVLNDSGESMQWTEMEDGVPVVRSPRLQRRDEDIRVSLDDLCRSVESWTLTDDGDSLLLEAQGFTLALMNEKTGFAAAVDGIEMMTENGDFDFREGHFIRANFLARALDGSWEWDQEEETLMLRIPQKNPALYSD
jgi:peptidoglycan hydrolase-like protein with peptidoglycan-binding domain